MRRFAVFFLLIVLVILISLDIGLLVGQKEIKL